MLEILQHLKSSPLLAEGLVQAFTFWKPINNEGILGAHPISVELCGGTNLSDVFIDTTNSKEVMVSSCITEQDTFEFQGSIQPELLNMTPYKPHVCHLPQNYGLDSLDNFKDLNILSKVDNVTNNVTNQEYYNQWDRQYICYRYNGDLEQATIELGNNIILEEKEDVFYQQADQYHQWDNTPYTPVKEDEGGSSHTFNVDNHVFNITKIKQIGKLKTKTVSELSVSNNKSDFYIGKRQL